MAELLLHGDLAYQHTLERWPWRGGLDPGGACPVPALHWENILGTKGLLFPVATLDPSSLFLHTTVRVLFSNPDGITWCPAENSSMVPPALRIKSRTLKRAEGFAWPGSCCPWHAPPPQPSGLQIAAHFRLPGPLHLS